MAGSVKGIIVEIGGDTSGLQKALSKVNSATSSLSKELKGINSLLKLDPKNTELLSQKQTVLKENIKLTIEQINNLKEAQRRYIESGGDLNTAEYRKLQREIINTQNKLSDLKNGASNWTKAGDQLIKWGENLDKISSKLDNLGNKLTTRLTIPIAGIVTAGLSYNAEIEKYTTSFATFLGDAKEAEKVINQIKNDAAKSPFDVSSLVRANQMLIATGENGKDAQEVILALGDAVTATGGGNDELTRMASNLQQIKNAGNATAMDIRQFAYAGIDIYGLLADYTGKTTKEVKEMSVSYDVLTEALKKANKQGGKYYNAMNNASNTLTGQVNQLKSEVKDMTGELTKSLMPVAKKVVSKAKEIIQKFDSLSDAQKDNIVKIGLMVAAAGPLLKIGSSAISIVGNVSKGIGTFSKAISLAHNGIGTATGSAATLAKVLQGLTSPAGIAAIGITAAVGIIIAETQKAEQKVRDNFSSMGNSASDFITGIDSATSHLDSFNSTLFASTEEQQELQEQMQEIQDGITKICKTASDERRDYTQEEITQLDEYFTKLRELKNREIEIQSKIAGAITQQALTNAETFKGSLEEYKVQSQEWIKTAQEQANKTISIIEQGSIEEVALLNQRYGEQATMQNEAYATEYNNLMEQKHQKIDLANDEVAKVNEAYANGYYQRSEDNKKFAEVIKQLNAEAEKENKRYEEEINKINNTISNNVTRRNQAIIDEESYHNLMMEKIYKQAYKGMSEWEAKQLGIWMAQVSNTEMYGGKINDETKEIISGIINSYDAMPDDTRKAMKNAMQPLLEEMQKQEPSLYAKASNIANGILNRLKKSFDIHSPSKKTRKIFNQVMQGSELGLEDEKSSLYKKVEQISSGLLDKFKSLTLGEINMGNLKNNIIDSTKTIFTTPQITFNVQKLGEAELQQCFNYINRKFGSQY